MAATTSKGTRRTTRRLPKAPPEAYRKVGEEVLRKSFDPQCWAQALAISDGGSDETVAHYARIRTKALAEQFKGEEVKQRNLEERQRDSYRQMADLPTEPPAPRWQKPLNWRGVADSVFWHAVAAVGVISCLTAVGAIWPTFRESIGWGLILSFVIVLQFVPLAGWWAGRGFLDSFRYPGVVQLSACCSVAASIALGAYLLTRPASTGESTLPRLPDYIVSEAGPAEEAEVLEVSVASEGEEAVSAR